MYVDMHAQTWPRSPGINVATHKSWSCCLSWCSFAECGSKSTLISGGAGGCAQGPVHCRWRYACLCIACGSHVCCRTARASLHLLKRSVGLRCDGDPFLGLWACMLFAFLHCVPCMWNQAQENMNGRCNLSQLNALFAEGKTHMPWAQNWDHTFGSWATNFSIVAPFLGPESGPCFGATKHKQELVNTGSKCATADASWQQHISVILRGYMPEALALPLIWGSSFGALGPPRLWEEAPPKP